MKSKKYLKILLGVLVLSTILFSCENNIDEGADFDSVETVALTYVANMFESMNVLNPRNSFENSEEDFFSNMDIEDEYGNKICFSDLSPFEKELLKLDLTEGYVDDLTKQLEEDNGLLELIQIENEAFKNAIRSSRNKNLSQEDFIIRLMSEFERLSVKKESRNSSGKLKDIERDKINTSSVQKLKSVYKKGRVLVSKDSSTSSSGFGHASIMNYDKWNPAWENNMILKCTMTSSPIEKGGNWDGKFDGVQEEPIGAWCGTSEGSAKTVSILDVGKSKFVWKGVNSYWSFTNASNNDYTKAANNASDKEGRPYSELYEMINKKNTDSYYCSQLVWRAWYDVSNEYDLSTTFFVLPSHLITSKNSRLVTSYSNK